jgi:hypothetical protein
LIFAGMSSNSSCALPKAKSVRIAPDCEVMVLTIGALIQLKEGTSDPKHQQQLAVLKETLRSGSGF